MALSGPQSVTAISRRHATRTIPQRDVSALEQVEVRFFNPIIGQLSLCRFSLFLQLPLLHPDGRDLPGLSLGITFVAIDLALRRSPLLGFLLLRLPRQLGLF